MPAKSVAQQQMMGIALHDPGKLCARNKGVLGMKKSRLHDFASTPSKNLPKKVKKRKRSRAAVEFERMQG